ncbi:hypothetical protein BCM02_11543 [Paenibacillus methanolicus]|uniref:Uncharacterized protein n=1 Tax=Paenibacillus methanolicus TaxID=582686 RepID=A0A5S5BUX4_9BACL|nr:hypothetical protein BCM02_11543 [Paenibacillus methanolicus]
MGLASQIRAPVWKRIPIPVLVRMVARSYLVSLNVVKLNMLLFALIPFSPVATT